MFMSMGEPMNNWNSLRGAMYELYKQFPTARLLISTSAPRMFGSFRDLCEVSVEIPTIGLQFSVHESSDENRKKLIPSPTMTLEEMAEEGVKWYVATGRHPFFNYCVHSGNNTQDDVNRLLKHFDPHIWESTLSVICERDETMSGANDRQRQLTVDFSQKMLNAGYGVRVFDPAGQSDSCGCGQLWHVQRWMKENPELAKKSLGFGKPPIHVPEMI